MNRLIVLALVGLGAQLVDGSLGMGYGITSTTLLLVLGTAPVAASATVHLAELGTSLVSGLAHWRFGNVDWRLVTMLGVPGAVGAFAGATMLTRLPVEVATPLMSALLLAIGIYVLARFLIVATPSRRGRRPLSARFLLPLGVVAGVVDATGGGGWGPVGTSAIIATGRVEPRRVVGSVDTSEFLVSLAASLGFLLALGTQGVDGAAVLGLLLGGVVAAPVAAWLVRRLPTRVLGSAVGALLIVTNAHNLIDRSRVIPRTSAGQVVLALVATICVYAVGLAILWVRLEHADQPPSPTEWARDREAFAPFLQPGEPSPTGGTPDGEGGGPGYKPHAHPCDEVLGRRS